MITKTMLRYMNAYKDEYTNFDSLAYFKKQHPAYTRRIGMDCALVVEEATFEEGRGWYSKDLERFLSPFEEPLYAFAVK